MADLDETMVTIDGSQYILWEQSTAILSQTTGYGVLLGFALVFSVFTVVLQKCTSKVNRAESTVDYFFSAGRSVGTGLSASVIVSKWTWAASLLQSASMGYKYGVSGPFWYASGACIQILLFSTIAVYMKHNVPKARTFLEIVKARFGGTIHNVFLVFALLTNLIVTAMLLLGGAAVVEDLTGVPKELGAFLIPIGVIGYTMSGGVMGTFMASYVQTAIIMIMLTLFTYTVFLGDMIGGADGMFDKLAATQGINIIDKVAFETDGTIDVVYDKVAMLTGNRGNGYLTMASDGGMIFGIINIVGNFGTVFVDQSYWQSAVAAKPHAGAPAFLIAGLVWFAIPFCLATSLGMATAALNIPISMNEVNNGLTAAKGATALMGSGGGVGILVMLFMAVTSTGSAELIAVASLFTYDVYYKSRKNFLDGLEPEEADEQLKMVSRVFIVCFGFLMGVLAMLLQLLGLGLGYIYMSMGIMVGSAVAPSFAVVCWGKLNGHAAAAAIIGGFVCAVTAWMATTASLNDGEISIATTGGNIPLLVASLVALITGLLITVVGTLMKPKPCDWKEVNARIQGEKVPPQHKFKDDAEFIKHKNMSIRVGLGLTFFLVVLWPLPMYFSDFVFDKPFFKFWVAICFIWCTVGTIVIIALPIRDAYKLYTTYNSADHQPVPTRERKSTQSKGATSAESAYWENQGRKLKKGRV